MQYSIVYTRLAKSDIGEIVTYISETPKAPKAALDLISALEKSIKTLEKFPYAHQVYITNKMLENEYRFIPVKNYLVFYTVKEDKKKVVIYRVFYGSMDYASRL
jgi:plasmid stabilization system protein ParE